ncbi:hypothetical protein HD597_007241 [Nonomuraea thailandensis]|uniref:LPXTG-motif cell wall anchor domain-containing protein n=1 Tax=Nonomuraea thailandensis TaxID=1188745 RepID=A0A9X2K7W7_9ACTN|nr:hypothetical protein [Nonomuraea thailandensis]MCP2360221.1 hypothetical protein [Nonomuraea thailandensis]
MTFPLSARRLCVLLITAACAALVPAHAAVAHPFGPPSTAKVGADGNRVTLAWLPAEDDWVALGRSVGAFEAPTTAADTSLTGEQKLARSTAVRDYLLAHVGVTQAGRPCAAELAPLERLLAEGARFSFECPERVVDVDVRVGALADLHEAYRTMLTAETPAEPAKALLTAEADTRRLRFDPSATGGTSLVAPAVALVAVLGVLAALLLRRRRYSDVRA